MKTRLSIIISFIFSLLFISCENKDKGDSINILFLHHSTGNIIWNGASSNSKNAEFPSLVQKYNKDHNKNYVIKEMSFPKAKPYGWKNYPFDYYNIWVKNAGENPFTEEPTLEILSRNFQVIIFKHCFPVSNIKPDSISQDIDSEIKTLANYKLQYEALRNKLNSFTDTKFILWTGAAKVQASIEVSEAQRAKEFFEWVIKEWDMPDDNIYLWDFYGLQTEGGLFFKNEYAVSTKDSHPNKEFAGKTVAFLFKRVIDIIENNGEVTNLDGSAKLN